MNVKTKFDNIPHVKDSLKIVDSETYRVLFDKQKEEELNKNLLISKLNKIEENDADLILSSDLKEIYKQVQKNCKNLRDKISRKVNEIDNNISISNFNSSYRSRIGNYSLEEKNLNKILSRRSYILENEDIFE